MNQYIKNDERQVIKLNSKKTYKIYKLFKKMLSVVSRAARVGQRSLATLLIKNGEVITHEERFHADVLCEDGIITRV